MKYFLVILWLSMAFFSCETHKESKTFHNKPNIILIMADDLGFSDIGSYGGEIETPNLDDLASTGIRYTQFYNNARCCPTRASLMTGVYPHQAGMGWMTAADLGTPQYQGELNNKSMTIAEVLKGNGYQTYMTGKWHLSRVRNIQAGIKDNWPSQRGFDHFFGIVDGASNYFTPMVFSNNKKYQAPNKDFYFTHAVSDSAVRYMDKHFTEEEDHPMFMYVAYTAPHWPLHALERDIKKYEEKYKKGWDRIRAERFAKQKELGLFNQQTGLSERDSKVPAWEDLTEEEKDDFVKRMAIYAAQVDAMDQGIGRIIKKLKDTDELDNTLILFLSDNGACAEFISSGPSREVTGEADTWESYRINWANAGSTPYKEYKHWIHEGGIATPMIVHWPDGLDANLKGGYVRTPGHIMDIMSTIVEVTDADYPREYKGNLIHSMQGQSLLPHFSGNENDRKPIYWEHEGNIGVRDGKWKLVAKTGENREFDPATLELYDMEKDPSELNNLADQHRERLEKMFEDWKNWAEVVKVYPIDTREYGKRARAYQRDLNGDFNHGFAGWQLKGGDKTVFVIDPDSAISGSNSARIKIKDSGTAMFWPLEVEKGEQFEISLKVKSLNEARIRVAFEPINGNNAALYQKEIKIGNRIEPLNFKTNPVPSNGRYRLAFYFDDNSPGTEIFIDEVRLKAGNH